MISRTEYTEQKNLLDSTFNVRTTVRNHCGIEKMMHKIQNEHRIIKTNKKNLDTVLEQLNSFAFNAYIVSDKSISVIFPDDAHEEKFAEAMKTQKIRIKSKTIY